PWHCRGSRKTGSAQFPAHQLPRARSANWPPELPPAHTPDSESTVHSSQTPAHTATPRSATSAATRSKSQTPTPAIPYAPDTRAASRPPQLSSVLLSPSAASPYLPISGVAPVPLLLPEPRVPARKCQ